ncbi:hypothetical protein DL765_003883 [Monosporascus sp. GIB2]|nr:hypothetical protein DL765_003883 [Monosporascus sp. GIB2]
MRVRGLLATRLTLISNTTSSSPSTTCSLESFTIATSSASTTHNSSNSGGASAPARHRTPRPRSQWTQSQAVLRNRRVPGEKLGPSPPSPPPTPKGPQEIDTSNYPAHELRLVEATQGLADSGPKDQT